MSCYVKEDEELQRLRGFVLSELSEPAEGASQGYSGDKERGRERDSWLKEWRGGKKRAGWMEWKKKTRRYTHCKTDCMEEKMLQITQILNVIS